ncbi:odorant receptor 49b-like [Andrena cerasifolii]|uniref:odorant receptor 49b-like n=1 Tax=Andrena cerasifolii TaxID=2819439 RepID=UPI004038391F
MSLMAITLCTLSLILFGIFVIGRQPLMVKLPFTFLIGTALLEVFMCAWPADTLREISGNVMAAVYESTWYTGSLELQKHVLYLLLPQKPVIISIKCVVPVLSLSYYSSFVSNAFSMFTALRVIITDDDEN